MDFESKLAKARFGDREALGELLEPYRRRLKSRLHGLLGAKMQVRADSSDIVQDALLQATRDVRSFNGDREEQWFAWLKAILKTQTANVIRKNCAQKRSVCQEARGSGSTASPRLSPLDQIVRDEERKTLRCAIDKLPTAQREVITRRIDDQQPFQEIATSMRRSNVAARVLWVRAMKRLRRSVRTE